MFLRLDVNVNVADGCYVLTCRVQGVVTFWGFRGQGWVQNNVVLDAVVMFGLRGVVFLGLENTVSHQYSRWWFHEHRFQSTLITVLQQQL